MDSIYIFSFKREHSKDQDEISKNLVALGKLGTRFFAGKMTFGNSLLGRKKE